MAMKWYVVHTYSGHENKAKLSLQERIAQRRAWTSSSARS